MNTSPPQQKAATVALPTTLSSHLVVQLRRRIIIGDYQPGQPLREQDLEREFGSSRGPVRESLRMLLQGGLVEYAERRGFRVRTYSPADVANLYDLRASLEGLVIASLAGKPLEGLVRDLNASNARMDGFLPTNDIEQYFAENQVFHDRIIAETGNRPLSEVMVYVNEVSLPVRYRVMRDVMLTRRSLDYHIRIAAFLRDGDLVAARAETEAHILTNKLSAVKLYT